MNKIVLLLIVMMVGQELKACDQCSAVVGSGAISEGHYIGYRLRYRRQLLAVSTAKNLDGAKHLDHFSSAGELKELYTAHELIGNYHIKGNWHLTASIPMVNNYRSLNSVTVHDIYGVGDPWIMARYQHVQEGDQSRFVYGAGLGIKFPLGETGVRKEGSLWT